ncbi:MAG: hypothetical protein A2020_02020 [Lentisphaerae bacterium GWF2_45_14]|nr:MAG: hypothetical protein A2020_02020 [Lentisphaerae bacterium GWF2_45_14]
MKDKILAQILGDVRSGKLDIVSALAELSSEKTVEDIGIAKIDHGRASRCGFPEFIYGEGKNAVQILEIMKKLKKTGKSVLATRVSPGKADYVLKKIKGSEYDEAAHCLFIKDTRKSPVKKGNILILTAGTSDIPVALEAKYTVELSGFRAETAFDAGVAGIHRLFSISSKLKNADVIVAVAGMEGALPSVVGGLVSCPVIAVPTSIGYGASLGGFTALLAMLNSCACGISVVNIDNGFGAACAAIRIMNSRA